MSTFTRWEEGDEIDFLAIVQSAIKHESNFLQADKSKCLSGNVQAPKLVMCLHIPR